MSVNKTSSSTTTAEVIIVGGGVIGLTIALALARRGVRDVTLIERGQPGAEASWAAGGSVELRFLVRGKGRVEGIGVPKKRGVSDAAAKCIADVVGRRYVGYPEAPIVAATATVSIIKKKR